MTSNEYITFAQRNRMKRIAISALLMTEKCQSKTLREVARQFSCDVRTVASVKSDLQQLGLVGVFPHDAPQVAVPAPTYLVFAERIDALTVWLRELHADGVWDENIARADAELQQIRLVVGQDGGLPEFVSVIAHKLDALEALAALPQYDLPTLTLDAA